MISVLYIEIDGYKIINGFGLASVDPVATQKKAGNEYLKCDCFIQQRKLSKESAQYLEMMRQATESYKLAEKKNEKDAMRQYAEAYTLRKVDFEKVQQQLLKLKPLLQKKQREYFSKNEVYFEPSKNEKHIDDATHDLLSNLFISNSYVDIDGNIIDDYRGVYAEKVDGKWIKHKINKLGEEPDPSWIKKESLTDEQKKEIFEQKNIKRISKLSVEKRQSEIENLKESALSESITMRSRLEILSDSNALKKSQEYYQQKCTEIDEYYNI